MVWAEYDFMDGDDVPKEARAKETLNMAKAKRTMEL
jgi:hypothetical protein